MGLIALPVSPHGLSTLLVDGEEETGEGSTVDMSALQSKLRQLQAFLGVEQTGSADDATREALKSFQWARGLEQTGTLNAETLKALAEANSELASITTLDVVRSYWWVYKWWIIGGAAVVVGGGLLWRSKKKRGKR
jgi:hypothetical protein